MRRCAPPALGACALLGACSVWVDDELSRRPGGGGAGAGGAEGTAGGGGQGGAAGCGVGCAAEACCDGACVDLRTSEAHCGACGQACAPTQACCDGVCTGDSALPCCADADCPGSKICSGNTCIEPCQGSLIACEGQCVDPSTSHDHCGACDRDCLAGRLCSGGACAPPWVTMSAAGAPSPREGAAVAWTGGAVFVWGGSDGTSDLDDGGLYDPAADAWAPVAAGGAAPSPRAFAAAVWAGAGVLVWGGGPSGGKSALGSGAVYRPATGTWSGVSKSLAPAPRRAPVAVWTGTHVLIWGGDANGLPVGGGALYDPAAGSWSPISEEGAPSARSGAATAWSGTEFYVFGGAPVGAGDTAEGFAYDPAEDAWRTLPPEGAPSARHGAFAAWVAGRFVVWGGEAAGGALDTGAQYDPAQDAWSPTGADGKPSKRSRRAGWSGWTGEAGGKALFLGGTDGNNVKKDGRLYDPGSGTWLPAGTAASSHVRGAGVWTGAEMVLWSGREGGALDATGERYMP